VICLLAGGAVAARLAAATFTLAWTHSVERIEWREDYALAPGGLRLVEARVQGSGAGMEPPEGSRLVDGWWVYGGGLPVLPALTLARSGAVADWRICQGGACREFTALLPPAARDAPTVTLQPCAP